MMKVVKTVFLTLLFILVITFSMENTGLVVLRYYFGLETPPIPVFLLVLFSVAVGVVLSSVAFLIDQWGLKRKLRQKEREVESLERELRLQRDREQGLAVTQSSQ